MPINKAKNVSIQDPYNHLILVQKVPISKCFLDVENYHQLLVKANLHVANCIDHHPQDTS